MSSKKEEVYQFIMQYKSEHNGLSPSYDQIREGCSISSKNSIALILRELINEGRIGREGTRGISIPNSEWIMKE